MRILLDYRPALRERTGVGEYAHELSRAVAASAAESGDSITLFSSSWKHRLTGGAVPGARAVDRRIPVRLLNYAWHRLSAPAVERLTRETYDVVQSFHPLLIPSRGAARLVTIHDVDFLDHPERTTREIRRDYPVLAALHAARADRVVANSRTTAREIQTRLGVPADRITVCYPGAPRWTPRTAEPDRGCLLFLGSLEPRKNVGILLEAYGRLLARMADAPPLVLAGKKGPASALLEANAADRPFTGRVDLPGYVPDGEREALFKRALAFIMPSHTEGFGMPVLEAMTVGVPVVAADRGALPEVAGDAGRYFEPDDAEALAALLHELVTSPSTRDVMRQRGWQRARMFSWQESAGSLHQAWKAALDARGRHRG